MGFVLKKVGVDFGRKMGAVLGKCPDGLGRCSQRKKCGCTEKLGS